MSFPGLFLSAGSTMIIVDYFVSSKGQNAGCEDRLWTNVPYLLTLHYPYKIDEVILPQGITIEQTNLIKLKGKVKLIPKKIEKLIKIALKHMENFMEFVPD